MQCPHVFIPMYVRNNTSMQCNVLMFAFQCMYSTIPQCNAMSSCFHPNVYTRQYINAMQCPHVSVPMYVRDNTSMQCNVLMFPYQCMYATIHQCNAMSSCLHSNVCTRQYINAMQCPHVCIPMCVRDWFSNRSGGLKKLIFEKLFRVKLGIRNFRLKSLLRFLIKINTCISVFSERFVFFRNLGEKSFTMGVKLITILAVRTCVNR